MTPLTKQEIKMQNLLHFWKIEYEDKLPKSINFQDVRDHCHYTGKYRVAARSICKFKFNVPYEIPAVFHKGSNYDYYFIIKE